MQKEYTDPPISSRQRNKVSKLAESEWKHWNETSSAITKWLLATLITMNLGGMAFASTSGLHPDAQREASSLFFFALIFAMASGVAELVRIRVLKELVLDVEIAKGPGSVTQSQFTDAIYGLSKTYFPLLLSIASLAFFALAGATIQSSIKPCSAAELEVSKRQGSNTYSFGRGGKTCFYYSIKGLPDDPLERAIAEERLINTQK